jgi:hypothetical protein
MLLHLAKVQMDNAKEILEKSGGLQDQPGRPHDQPGKLQDQPGRLQDQPSCQQAEKEVNEEPLRMDSGLHLLKHLKGKQLFYNKRDSTLKEY